MVDEKKRKAVSPWCSFEGEYPPSLEKGSTFLLTFFNKLLKLFTTNIHSGKPRKLNTSWPAAHLSPPRDSPDFPHSVNLFLSRCCIHNNKLYSFRTCFYESPLHPYTPFPGTDAAHFLSILTTVGFRLLQLVVRRLFSPPGPPPPSRFRSGFVFLAHNFRNPLEYHEFAGASRPISTPTSLTDTVASKRIPIA